MTLRRSHRVNFCVFCLHCAVSISSSVFVNGTASFLLAEKASIDIDDLSSAVSSIIVADEILSLLSAIIWGATIDRIGLRRVMTLTHLLTAAGVACLGLLTRSYVAALLGRLVFAAGFSGLIVCLVSALASLGDAPPTTVPEEDPLLPAEGQRKPEKRPLHGGVLAGVGNLCAGLGALVAAFGLNRLPPLINLEWSYTIVVSIEVLMAMVVWSFFDTISRPAPQLSHLESLGRGFKLLRRDGEIAIACVGSFAARSQTTLVASWLPLLVNAFYTKSGLCEFDDADLPGQVKQSCRPAFALASSLTGTVQLVGLIGAPLCGLALARRVSKPSIWLFGGELIATAGFILLGLLPNGDPRLLGQSISASVLLGVSQAINLTTSLVLTSSSRQRYAQLPDAAEVSGAISSMYSVSGGVGILFVVQVGGLMSARFGIPAAFGLAAVCLFLAAVVSGCYACMARGK